MPAQISALSARTSTIAHSTSSGQAVAGGNSNSPSTVSAPSGGAASGGVGALGAAGNESLVFPLFVPAPPGMWGGRHAAPARPKGSATTAAAARPGTPAAP